MKKRVAAGLIGAAVSVAAAAVVPPVASAGLWDVWDEDTRLTVVKVMVGEAGYNLAPDHPAMIAVLLRRNELPFWRGKAVREVAMAYSMAVKEGLPPNENRTRTALVTRGSAPGEIMDLVDAIGDGAPLHPCDRTWAPGMICDPCRGRALHWGSLHDARQSPLPLVQCGRTHNVFLGEPRPPARRPRAIPIAGLIPAREAH